MRWRPNYQDGYASPANGEPMKHPWLWDGCILGCSAGLGPSGSKIWNHAIDYAPAWFVTAHSGTLSNMTLTTAWGEEPGALYFSGGATENVSWSSSAMGTANGFMISAWVKVPSTMTNNFHIVGKDDSNNNRIFQFRVNSDGTVKLIRFNTSDSVIANFSTTGTVNDNRWHNLSCWFNTTSGSAIYIDGVQDATNATTTANNDNSEPTYLGNRDGTGLGNAHEGWLDDVFFWSNDAAEVTQSRAEAIIRTMSRRRGIAFEMADPLPRIPEPVAGVAPATGFPFIRYYAGSGVV